MGVKIIGELSVRIISRSIPLIRDKQSKNYGPERTAGMTLVIAALLSQSNDNRNILLMEP